MADETNQEVQEPLITLTQAELDKKINATVRAQLKRMQKAPVSEEVERETEISLTPSPSGDTAELLKRLEKQDRAIKELTKKAKVEEEKARQMKAQNLLQSTLRGKIVDTWEDVAIERLSSHVSWEDDGTPKIQLDGLDHSIEEGVQEWLKSPANKRFLPAPKQATKLPITPKMDLPSLHSNQQSSGLTGRRSGPVSLTPEQKEAAFEAWQRTQK